MSQKQAQLLNPINGNINVSGIVTATSFSGDGSSLTSLPAGLGTALNSDKSTFLGNVYYQDQVFSIGSTVTIDVPSTAIVGYTPYAEIEISGDADLIVADGDEFIPNILGIGTEGVSSLGGSGGRIRADNYINSAGTGAPTFPSGVNVTGVATATQFKADSAIFSGNVSVAGTLTYQDVTNMDVLGIGTFQQGIQILANGANIAGIVTVGVTTIKSGEIEVVGVVTATTFKGNVTGNLTGDVTGNLTGDVNSGIITASTGINLDGYKVEEGDIETTSLNGEFDYNLENGHIQKFTGATGGNYQPDFKVNGSTSLDSIMDVGDVVTCTLMVASSSHYLASASIKIDDSASDLDIDNVGGSAPSSANGSGFDIYTFTIQKTAATPAYHIVVNTLGAN
jgi:hypothetical protein